MLPSYRNQSVDFYMMVTLFFKGFNVGIKSIDEDTQTTSILIFLKLCAVIVVRKHYLILTR